MPQATPTYRPSSGSSRGQDQVLAANQVNAIKTTIHVGRARSSVLVKFIGGIIKDCAREIRGLAPAGVRRSVAAAPVSDAAGVETAYSLVYYPSDGLRSPLVGEQFRMGDRHALPQPLAFLITHQIQGSILDL